MKMKMMTTKLELNEPCKTESKLALEVELAMVGDYI